MEVDEVSLIPDEVWRRIRFHRRVNAVVEHVREHPVPITLSEAAAIACMERTSFCRFFSKSVGMGFSEFLAEYRTEVAIKRMLESDAGLKEIAAGVGFGSLATFQRRFTRATGLSPSAFRSRRLGR